MSRQKKTVIALVLAFTLTIILSRTVFSTNTPLVTTQFLSKLLFLEIKFPTLPIPTAQPSSSLSFYTPQNIPLPTNEPTIKYDISITKAQLPISKIPSPISKTPSPKPKPTIKPTAIPTSKPIQPTSPPPTTKPTPTVAYKPEPTTAPSVPYPETSNETYDTIEILSAVTDRPAAQHPDLNLSIRGYAKTTGNTGLVDLGGDTDLKAPQFTTFVASNRYPPIITLYRVYNWNWDTYSRGGLIGYPDATLFGVQTVPGEPLHIPESQYDIGGAHQAMVLYATKTSITMKYGREDNVVIGYVVHAEDIWVDPNLLKLYNEMNASGRQSLPAIRNNQVFGYAQSNETKMVIRDTGEFMDLRSRKDWWH